MKSIITTIMMIVGFCAFADSTNETWMVMNKETHQFVGFETKNGSAVLVENGTNIVHMINKTNHNTEATSYTPDELKKMFSALWDEPDFFSYMDKKFELMRVDNSKGMVVILGKKFSDLEKMTTR